MTSRCEVAKASKLLRNHSKKEKKKEKKKRKKNVGWHGFGGCQDFFYIGSGIEGLGHEDFT